MKERLSWYDYLQMAPAAESQFDFEIRLGVYRDEWADVQRRVRRHKIDAYEAAKHLNAIANLELAFRANSAKAGYKEEISG